MNELGEDSKTGPSFVSSQCGHIEGPTAGRPRMPMPGTRRVGALTGVPALIRGFGVDPNPVLAAAGVTRGTLDFASNRIPYENLARLIAEAAARTDCPHFGVLAGDLWRLSDMGLIGELARNSPTVGAALQEFVLHQHLDSVGGVAFLLQRGEFVDFGYAIYFPLFERTFYVYDAILAAGANFLRELCGDGLRLTRAYFVRKAPADLAPYQRCFGTSLEFNSTFCALRFPVKWLSWRVDGAQPERLHIAREQLKAVEQPAIVDTVFRSLRTLLLHGKGSGAEVARSLAMHRRTLNRRLKDEGATFQEVLDSVRFAVAKELLENTDIAMPEIAHALGYADFVSFLRAFRRWVGTTPGAWRQSA